MCHASELFFRNFRFDVAGHERLKRWPYILDLTAHEVTASFSKCSLQSSCVTWHEESEWFQVRSALTSPHSCLRYAKGLPIQPERPSHFSCCFCINYSVQGLGFLCAQVLWFYWIRTSVNNTCWNFFAWKNDEK